MRMIFKKIALLILLSLIYIKPSFANCCYVTFPSSPNNPPFSIVISPDGSGGNGSGGGGFQTPNAMDQEINRFNNETMSMMNQQQNKAMRESNERLQNAIENFKKIEEMNKKSLAQFENYDPFKKLDAIRKPLAPSPLIADDNVTYVQTDINENIEDINYTSPFLVKGAEQTKQDFIAAIQSPNYIEAERQIDNAIDYFLREKKEENTRKKNEIKQVVNSILNENGFVKDYIPYYPKLQNYFLKTQINSENSYSVEYILQNINKALHILKYSYSPASIEKAEVIIENSLKADVFKANGYKIQANRLLDRGYTSLIFYENKQDKNFANRKLSQHAKRFFYVDENIKATTSYENYQIIQLANGLARELNRNSEHANGDFYTLSNIALKQVQESSIANYSVKEFENSLDNAWVYADIMSDISKGTAKGIYQVAEDTVLGTYELVTHPVESAKSLWSAIYNYDKTYEVIVNKIKENIDHFPNLSVEEKAKFITQASLEVATLVTPRGLLKSTAELNKIAKASTLATTKIVDDYSKMLPPAKNPNSNSTFIADNIPGGTLDLHERYKNGHLVRDHVIIENDMLKARAGEHPKMDYQVSSFPNFAIAEQAVANTINQNKTNIDNWLKDSSAKGNKQFSSLNPSIHSTGTLYDKQTDQFKSVNNSKVILVKDKKFPEGYRIATGFPIE